MGDTDRTNAELLAEIDALRKQVADLQHEAEARKQTEEALQESEQKWRLLAQTSTDYIMTVDPKGVLQCINRPGPGLTEEQVIGLPIMQWVPPESRRNITECLDRVVATGQPDVYETEYVTETGERQYFEARVAPVMKDGVVAALTISSCDITARRRAQLALQNSEARYRAMFENATEGILFAEAETGRFRYANPAICRMLGYSEAELLSMAVTDIHPPEDLADVMAHFERQVRGEEALAHGLRCMRKDGEIISVDITACPHVTVDGVECAVGFFTDITEHRQHEEALRQSEERYRALVEHSRDGINIYEIVDVNGTQWRQLVYCNDRYVEMSGRSRAELMAAENLDLLSVSRLSTDELAEREKRRSLGLPLTGVSSWLRPDGKENYYEWITVPVNIESRDCWLGMDRDITMRRHAEEALRDSEERYRATIDAMDDMIHVVDRELRFTLVNACFHRWCQDLGLGDDPIGKTVPEFFPFLTDKIWREYERVFESGETLVTEEEVSVEEHEFVTETRKIPVVEHDRVARVVTIVRDITARRRAVEALQESEERYRQLVDLGPDAVVILQDGVYRFVNPAFTALFGYTQSDVAAGLSFLDLVQDEDRPAVRQRYEQRLAGEDLSRTYEIDLVAKDGSIVPCETSAAMIQHDGRPADLVIIRDVTERRRVEEELRQAHKMEAVGRLAAGIAHDFNNMMTPIIGYARFLLRDLPEDAPTRRYADVIMRTATRAASLPRRLLAFSRKQTLKPERLAVNALITDMNKMLMRVIGEDIDIVNRLASTELTVHADPIQIEQILLNLAVNAREAMPEGGRLTVMTASAKMPASTPAEAEREAVCITVTDTGMGMDDEVMASIFEPYYTTKGLATNTGLGLSVVHGIVEQHDGRIEVESEPGQGSTFRISLPTAPPGDASEPEPAAPQADGAPQGKGEGILLVEDDPGVLRFLAWALRDSGYVVFETRNAEQAQQIFAEERQRIQLVLSDVLLPGQTGIDLVDALIAEKPELKALLCSGYIGEQAHAEAIRSRGLQLMHKPFMIPELLQSVQQALNSD